MSFLLFQSDSISRFSIIGTSFNRHLIICPTSQKIYDITMKYFYIILLKACQFFCNLTIQNLTEVRNHWNMTAGTTINASPGQFSDYLMWAKITECNFNYHANLRCFQ